MLETVIVRKRIYEEAFSYGKDAIGVVLGQKLK